MSSLRRTGNQSAREGTSMRRHALSGPTTKSMKNVTHTNAVPSSPLRYRTKYELRSISLEGNKVLPWTSR
ncbi:gtpase-activating rap ran-gap domain-like protein 3-like protein [Lasius niger]|uniref:Gtpase-activating rap ran-gap domain-like protein 3-like protein n=2 Tax=Lasius TaxID=488720 RepID=A0A0J7KI32_LASNI|nr:gtpase-activating rap ran-gap domain-like protein 3-like protein [Lasius niger]